MSGYCSLFGMLILLQIASNIGQAAQQGLIPDLVRKITRACLGRQGAARSPPSHDPGLLYDCQADSAEGTL